MTYADYYAGRNQANNYAMPSRPQYGAPWRNRQMAATPYGASPGYMQPQYQAAPSPLPIIGGNRPPVDFSAYMQPQYPQQGGPMDFGPYRPWLRQRRPQYTEQMVPYQHGSPYAY